MEIFEPYTTQTISYTLPNGVTASAVTATLYFEDGTSLGTCTYTTADNKTYVFTILGTKTASSGVYRLKIDYTVSAVVYHQSVPFQITRIYTTNLEDVKAINAFDDNYVEQVISFNKAVSAAGRIIDTFCGQNFQIVFNQAREFDGKGKSNLWLVNRLDTLTSVVIDSSDTQDELDSEDQTANCELDPASDNFWLRCALRGDLSKFTAGSTVTVTGDWGYQEPPYNVQLAGDILIGDLFDDVRREKQAYAIDKIWQSTNRLGFYDLGLSSTGNQDADMLLIDHVLWTMDYI